MRIKLNTKGVRKNGLYFTKRSQHTFKGHLKLRFTGEQTPERVFPKRISDQTFQLFCCCQWEKTFFSLMQRFDILLIEVVRPFVFNDFVKKAALPVLEFPAGTPVVVTGWGLTSEGWSISWCATVSTVVLSLNVELSGSIPSLKSIGFIS